MSIVDGKITAPVGISDLQRVLGTTEGDLGTIIRSGLINMWAKFKPVWAQDYPTLSTAGFAAAYSGYTNPNPADSNYNHVDGDYGVACTGRYQGTRNNFLAHFSEIKDAEWTYAHPKGAGYTDAYGRIPACPYRITDFVGYKHSATAPIYLASSHIRVNRSAIDSSKIANILFNVVEANDDAYVVGLETLTRNGLNLKTTKFCVVATNGINNVLFEDDEYIMASDGSLNEGQYVLSIDVTSSAYTNYFGTGGVTFYCFMETEIQDENPIFTPIPSDGVHQRYGTIEVYSDQGESGYGVEEVWVSADLTSISSISSNFKEYSDISEEQGGSYTLRNYDGNMAFAVLFHNAGTSAVTIQRRTFSLTDTNDWNEAGAGGGIPPYPTRMYVGDDMNSAGSYDVDSYHTTDSYTIGAGKYRWVLLQWDNIFNGSEYNSTRKGSAAEIVLTAQSGDNVILNDVLYIYRGSGGWAFELL